MDPEVATYVHELRWTLEQVAGIHLGEFRLTRDLAERQGRGTA